MESRFLPKRSRPCSPPSARALVVVSVAVVCLLLVSAGAPAAAARQPQRDYHDDVVVDDDGNGTNGTVTGKGRCVWYGQCGDNDAKTAQLNCRYTGQAPCLDERTEHFRLLKETCPMLISERVNETRACCDLAQVMTLHKSLGLSEALLSGCPSCAYNFRQLFCYSTCSPNQLEFMRYAANDAGETFGVFVSGSARTVAQNAQADSTCKLEDDDDYADELEQVDESVGELGAAAADVGLNYTSVKAVEYYLDQQQAMAFYNSCKNVQYSSTQTKVIGMLCGRSADQCKPKDFFTFLGLPPHAPFKISFIMVLRVHNASNVTAMHARSRRCDEPTLPSNKTCSCQDCPSPQRCPSLPPVPAEHHFLIFGFDGYTFIILVSYGVLLLVSMAFILCRADVLSNRWQSVKSVDEIATSAPLANGEDASQTKGNGKRSHHGSDPPPPMDVGCWQRMEEKGAALEMALKKAFQSWGVLVANNPFKVLLVTIMITGGLCSGVMLFKVTTDPVDLWSAPNSESRTHKDYFDDKFGPFFRPDMLIIQAPDDYSWYPDEVNSFTMPYGSPANFGPVMYPAILLEVIRLEQAVKALRAPYTVLAANGTSYETNVTLSDVCFKPLDPVNQACSVESFSQWFQGNETRFNLTYTKMQDGWPVYLGWHEHLYHCANAPFDTNSQNADGLNISCLADFGGPAMPNVVLGGYEGKEYTNATALIVTFVVNNFVDESKNGPAEAWEKRLIQFIQEEYTNPLNLTISMNTQRSIEDEVNRESKADEITIAVSYLLMFVYIAFTLGQIRLNRLSRILIDAKFVLGLAGVLIVLSAVGASLGFFAFVGVHATLIIIEVVPFLVLAVGVDNLCILVQAFQRDVQQPHESTEEQFGRIVGEVAPSMLLTGLSESAAFFLGALSTMPAVRTFSLYAGMAVFINFLLQISCFLAVMALDVKRQRDNRLDICCCVQAPKKEHDHGDAGRGLIYIFMQDIYSPFLMRFPVRIITLVIFSFMFVGSLTRVPKLSVGLDQTLALPRDSYLLDYFADMNKLFRVGSPVYFVVKGGFDYAKDVNKVCKTAGCDQFSLGAQISMAAKQSNYTRIALPASSWVDDYLQWISPSVSCCRLVNGNFDQFCNASVTSGVANCTACLNATSLNNGHPSVEDFRAFLNKFLSDIPTTDCAKGGKAAYNSAINRLPSLENQPIQSVEASYFMTYHTVCRTSEDYTNALKQARRIAANITKELGVEVFPYSYFYVFYEQYLTLVHDAAVNLGFCGGAIFVVSFILMGFSFSSALITLITICMIVVDIMGVMYYWDISFNAVSLVNLVMAVGISVEFCAHIVRKFSISTEPTRIDRAKDALANMGSSVISGITLTKFVGIIVLYFAKSQLFQIFYFRMYLCMVVFGASHGLIFLPVLLSFVGPRCPTVSSVRSRLSERSPLLGQSN